jgi:Amt family ammonium transporter
VEQRKIFLPGLILLTLTISTFTFAQEPAQKSMDVPSLAPALAAPAAPVAAPVKIDKGDTAWMLTSAALVLMMTIPGLFLFYGGLVRRKNVLGTIMHSFIIVALISVQWVCGDTRWRLARTSAASSAALIGSA